MMSTEERVQSPLSPDEHAALMDGLRSGALPGIEAAALAQHGTLRRKHVKSYDFRRPEKFSRDQLRTIRGIHEQLVRLLNSSLAAYLRTTVETALEGVEQQAYHEFTAETEEGNLIYVINLDPLPAPMLLEVSTSLVFASLDRLLGGTGKRLAQEREPTEMERSLFQENWLLPVLENVCTAWQTIISLTPQVTAVETNAGFVHIALPTDVVVSVKFTANIADASGPLRLCYTYATLEPIVPQLDAQRLVGSGMARRRPDDSENVRRGLRGISVPLVARLGMADVTMEELLGLQRGDVIRLDTLVEREVDLLINGEVKYRGRPGLVKSRLAVRVTEAAKSEAEEPLEEQLLEGLNGGAA
jgi:flagellar motor switch protein FliM